MAIDSSFFGSSANSNSLSGIFAVLAQQQTLTENAANTALSNGITYMQNNKYDKAAIAFKQASAYNPTLTEAYTFLGDAYGRLGKNKQAIDAYKLSLKVDKTQDTLYTTLANLYIDQKQPADAEKILKDGIRENNQNTLAYYTLGQLMAQRGAYKDAETQFRQVTKLEPKDGNGYYALGMALNGQGRYSDAITQLKRAVSLKKDFVPAIAELGKAYNGIGDTVDAQQQLDKLNNIGTSNALIAARDLSNQITKPGLSYIDFAGTSLPLALGNTSLLALAPTTFNTANASKNFTVKLGFNTEMDAQSVTNITNWSISRASGGAGGIYNNGLYSPTNISAPAIPTQVTYDPVNMEATLTFSLTQNATKDGTIDPKHLVFKFNGTDVQGKSMDSKADQIDGFSISAF